MEYHRNNLSIDLDEQTVKALDEWNMDGLDFDPDNIDLSAETPAFRDAICTLDKKDLTENLITQCEAESSLTDDPVAQNCDHSPVMN